MNKKIQDAAVLENCLENILFLMSLKDNHATRTHTIRWSSGFYRVRSAFVVNNDFKHEIKSKERGKREKEREDNGSRAYAARGWWTPAATTRAVHQDTARGADRYGNTRGINHVRNTLPVDETCGGTSCAAAQFCLRRDARYTQCIYEGTYFHAVSAGSRRRWWQGNKRRLSRQIASLQPRARVIARLLFRIRPRRLPSFLFLRRNSLGFPSFASWPPLVADYLA